MRKESLKIRTIPTFIHIVVGVVILVWSALMAKKVGNDFLGSTFMTIITFIVCNILFWVAYLLIEKAVGLLLGVNDSNSKNALSQEPKDIKEVEEPIEEIDEEKQIIVQENEQSKEDIARKQLAKTFFYKNYDVVDEFIDGCKGLTAQRIINLFHRYIKEKKAKEYEKGEKTILYNCLTDLGLITVKQNTFKNIVYSN